MRDEDRLEARVANVVRQRQANDCVVAAVALEEVGIMASGRKVQTEWQDGEGRARTVSVSDDDLGRWVVDLPGVHFLAPAPILGGVLALTREAATALRDALNQLPLPPAPGG